MAGIRRYLVGAAAIVLATNTLGATLAPTAAVAKANPPGAVKLPKSGLKRTQGIVCGNLHRNWLPGSVLRSGYFLSDIQQSRNFTALGRHAKGAAKKRDLAQAKFYSKRAKTRQPTCTQAGRTTLASTPQPTPTATPLRFNIGGATALALQGTTTMHAVRRMAVQASAPAVGSNLQAVSGSGQLSDAVSSGTASISHFLIGPTGKLYVGFAQPVNLSNTSSPTWPSSGCVLAQVDPSTGIPACIDSSLSMIAWSGVSPDPSPAIQFDDAGGIYYTGSANGTTVLRRYLNGVSTNLIAPGIDLQHWLVMGDGSVLITGETWATSATWTRRIDPSGSVQTIAPRWANFLAAFPDNNAYIGTDSGVFRYLTSEHRLDPEPWLSSTPGTTAWNDATTICSTNHSGLNGSCGWNLNYMTSSFQTSDGKEIVTAGFGGSSGAVAMQYYPTVKFLSTEVKNVSVAHAAGNNLLLAGLTGAGQNVLTLYNTATDTETELIGPSNEIEIYHLDYVVSQNKVMFDGLRFSDNNYVIGSVDLGTHQVNTVATSSAKWADLQTFG
jgi:hypothetical protein